MKLYLVKNGDVVVGIFKTYGEALSFSNTCSGSITIDTYERG